MRVSQVQNEESLRRFLEELSEFDRIDVSNRLRLRAVLRLWPHISSELCGIIDDRPSFVAILAIFYTQAIFEISDRADPNLIPSYLGDVVKKASTFAEIPSAFNPLLQSRWGWNSGGVFHFEELPFLIHNIDIWPIVRSDLTGSVHGRLWPDGLPDEFERNWAHTRKRLKADSDADWSFWISWYERVVAGRNTFPDALASALNNITKEVWDLGPAHVNSMFQEVLGLYLADDFIAANPYGFRAGVDQAKQRLTLSAREPVDMSEIIQKLRTAFRDFNRRAKRADAQSNVMAICKDALDPEIADLKKVISKYQEDAQALHFELKRYEKRLAGVLADRGLPTTSETASLIDDLRMLQDEICLISKPVRAAEKQRHAIALERATDDQLLLAIRSCAGMATDGVGQMRVFATLAMKALANPDATTDEKQMAWMFAYRMGIESAALITSSEEGGNEQGGGFGKRIKEASDLLVAADKSADVVQEAVSEGGHWFQQLLEAFSQNPSIPGT